MMKDRMFVFWLVATLMAACALVACTSSGAKVKTQANRGEVGQAMEGDYAVYHGGAQEPTGHLSLSGGRYVYRPVAGASQEPALGQRFFFVRHLEGTYRVEYYGNVASKSVLKALDDHDILLTVFFDAPDAKNHTPDPHSDTDRVFLIRNDKAASRLYFHSTVSEVQNWRVDKPWP